eukprot:Skav211891  [mRNA]  locus=scaffold2402:155810:156859:- [translate_table: standard]
MELKYQCYHETRNVTDQPQLLKFQVDCRGATFQNLTVDDYYGVCPRLTYRKYGNSVSRPSIEMLPWITDAALRLEREDVVDIECIPKDFFWTWTRYVRNRTWFWNMIFRLTVNGVHDAGHPHLFHAVFFQMNFLPDMGACLTALAKKYDWTLVPLEEQSTNYSSQFVRYSSPTLDFPPQNLFAQLGSDPVYDFQVTGDIFQSNKDSLYAKVLKATLDTKTWTDLEPAEDWLVRLDPNFYSSVVEIPNLFALDFKLDINTAVLPFVVNDIRITMGFKLRRKFMPYDLKLSVVANETPEDSRLVIWLLVAFFLVTLVAALSYVYQEKCRDLAARAFLPGRRTDEAIEMRLR